MPKQSIIPAGSGKPLAPYVPGSMADGVVYVSGTLPFDKDNNVVHVGDAAAQTAMCWKPSRASSRPPAAAWTTSPST